ncbi:MAG: C2 domain-containing protein, partial [Benniella sp.]
STMTHSVHIVARHADSLPDVERLGKNDPYAQFSLNLADDKSFKPTSVKKNAGKSVEWNETVILDNYNPAQHRFLYVDVYDQEALADEVIGFASIPLYQAADAPNKSFKGKFQLYDDDNKEKGSISLTISIVESDKVGSFVANDGAEVQGQSSAEEDHKKHIKSQKRKEKASDAATVAAVGAALFGLKSVLGGGKEANKEA